MNDWQLLNNWFVNNAILYLEIINWSLIKYETRYRYAFKSWKKAFMGVILNCLLMVYEWCINCLLILNKLL